MKKTLGAHLSPVLEELAMAIMNRDNFLSENPSEAGPAGFTHGDMMNALHIFVSTALDVAYELNKEEANPAEFGKKISQLVLDFTTIDPTTYYGPRDNPEI